MADIVGTDEGWDQVERLVAGPVGGSMSDAAPSFRSEEYRRGYNAGYRDALREAAQLRQHSERLRAARPKVARFEGR